MGKAFEFFDIWLRSQKDFLESWTRSQKGLMDDWLEATRKIRQSFDSMTSSQASTSQAFGLFSSWFTTMLNSMTAFIGGMTNLQNIWKTMVDKQVEINKEIAGYIFETMGEAGEKKRK